VDDGVPSHNKCPTSVEGRPPRRAGAEARKPESLTACLAERNYRLSSP
jgi:hypothetical protein